jgi:hypothetical protein
VPEALDEFEDVTDEVAREGDEPPGERVDTVRRKVRRQVEEFEELTEEPLREEDPS